MVNGELRRVFDVIPQHPGDYLDCVLGCLDSAGSVRETDHPTTVLRLPHPTDCSAPDGVRFDRQWPPGLGFAESAGGACRHGFSLERIRAVNGGHAVRGLGAHFSRRQLELECHSQEGPHPGSLRAVPYRPPPYLHRAVGCFAGHGDRAWRAALFYRGHPGSDRLEDEVDERRSFDGGGIRGPVHPLPPTSEGPGSLSLVGLAATSGPHTAPKQTDLSEETSQLP